MSQPSAYVRIKPPARCGRDPHAARVHRAALVRIGGLVEGGARVHAGFLHRVLQPLPGRARGQADDPRQCPDARRERAPVAALRLSAERDELDFLQHAHLGRPGLCRRRGRRVPPIGQGRRLPDPAARRHLRHEHGDGRHRRADCVRAGARRRGAERKRRQVEPLSRLVGRDPSTLDALMASSPSVFASPSTDSTTRTAS